MTQHVQNAPVLAPAPERSGSGLRLLASFVGIVAVVTGLVLAVLVFYAIYDNLTDPGDARRLIRRWSDALGGDDLVLEIRDQAYPAGQLLAVLVLGGGAAILGWLALGIMVTGAKVISWTASDREAIRRILRSAFGGSKPRAIEPVPEDQDTRGQPSA